MDVLAAYRHCEEITWSQARNFSYGIRLLPPPKRRALSAVYAFARRIDDIGDGELPAEQKLAALEQARASVDLLTGGGSARLGPDPDDPALRADPVLVALADAGHRFPIPLQAFGELIDGCEADVRGTSYPTFEDLRHYCRCVAGSIGRLSLGVFGTPDVAMAEPLADALGVALQLTNILRDIREDYRSGRVYLPAEDFDRFGAALRPERLRLAGRRPQADRPRAVRGRAGPRLVRARAGPHAAAGPPERGLHRGHGRDLLPAAAATSRPTRKRCCSGGYPCHPARRPWWPPGRWPAPHCGRAAPRRGRRPRRQERRNDPRGAAGGPARPRPGGAGPGCRGGGRRAGWPDRGHRAARGRPAGDHAGGQAAAGRGHHLVQPGRPDRGQRPACVPPLLHGLPGADRAGSACLARCPCRTASTSRC